MRLLHFFEQLGHRLGFRHEVNQSDERRDRRIRFAGRQRWQDVAHVNHSFNIVDLIAIDRQTGMPRFDDQVSGISHGRGPGQGHDLCPRRHDFAHARVAKLDG